MSSSPPHIGKELVIETSAKPKPKYDATESMFNSSGILRPKTIGVSAATAIEEIEEHLEKSKKDSTSVARSWNAINATDRVALLSDFAKTYCVENKLSESAVEILVQSLSSSLWQKRLSKNKDVEYDKERRCVRNIPALRYYNGRFTLSNVDQRHESIMNSVPRRSGTKTKKLSRKSRDAACDCKGNAK
jgi:hypothetical protein